MKTENEVSTEVLPELAEAIKPPRSSRRRLKLVGLYLLTVFMLVTLNFFLPRAMPSDPISAMLASASSAGGSVTSDESTKAALERYYGLDRPLGEQYLRYLGGLAHADLGVSIRYNQPVWDILAARLPWTLLLAAASMMVALGLGIPAGILAGWRRGGRVDRSLLTFFTAVANFPGFFVASIAVYVFAVKLNWVPLSGASTPFASLGPMERALDIAHHLALPAIILGLQFASGQFLLMRAGMVAELGSDYLLMGRAKGLTDKWLKYRYAARNAMLPSVSLSGLMLSFAVAGAIFVETVFAYPGIGRLAFEAAGSRDYPLMQGTFLLLSMSVVSLNLLADLAIGRLDPRVSR